MLGSVFVGYEGHVFVAHVLRRMQPELRHSSSLVRPLVLAGQQLISKYRRGLMLLKAPGNQIK